MKIRFYCRTKADLEYFAKKYNVDITFTYPSPPIYLFLENYDAATLAFCNFGL